MLLFFSEFHKELSEELSEIDIAFAYPAQYNNKKYMTASYRKTLVPERAFRPIFLITFYSQGDPKCTFPSFVPSYSH